MSSNTHRTNHQAVASGEPARRTVRVLGSRVDILDVEEAVAMVAGWIEAREPECRQVVVTGAPGAPARRAGVGAVCHCLEQAVPWRA